jgi:hypothetical protein
MAIADLSSIITKIRKLTSSPNSNQITDSDIIDYINSFYLYDFPAEFRSLDLKDIYTFNTVRGIDTYPFDIDHWVNVQEPCYVAKRETRLFQDPLQFYWFNFNSNSYWQREETLTEGDGTKGPYTNTLQAVPLIRSVNNNPIVTTNTPNTQVFPDGFPVTFPNSNINRIQNFLITADLGNGTTLNVTDDGAGGLLGNATAGSVKYDTGAVSVTFDQNVPSGEEIKVFYNPVVLNIPLAVLFFQNQFVLRPVPDKGYTVELMAYRLPSQALLGSGTDVDLTGRPELLEWWETLAVGAAKKIYEDRLDMDGVQMMDKILNERYQANYTRTYANLGKRRIATIYADQFEFTNGTGPFGVGNFS